MIKEMSLSDLERIKDSLYSEFDDFWTYNIFVEELKNEYSKYFCFIDSEEILGFAGVWQSIDVMHITNIVVRRDKRGQDIGKKLLEKLIEFSNERNVNSITLEVHEDNKIAQEMYKKYNFKFLGIRKNYYKDKNAMIFTLKLKNE